jgi:hypothetical protein
MLREDLLLRHGDAVEAILFYGSCLRSGDILDGLVDLYLVVASYQDAYQSRPLVLLNRLLPPNVFYLEIPWQNRLIRAKYGIISLRDLDRSTSMRWFHSYFWGRFAQPTGLLYARNASVAQQVTLVLAQAVMTFVTRVLPQLPTQFDPALLWKRGLGLSYSAELRPERPERVVQLFDTFRDRYVALTCAAMAALPYVAQAGAKGKPISYVAEISTHKRLLSRLGWTLRKAQGKLLSLLRLIKALFTFRGGVDYLAWKLERHSGIRVDVPPKLRRHPLLYAWGLMWRLYRRGVFR